MVDIRRITEPEAEIVTVLWDDMCQEPADGGPLRAPPVAGVRWPARAAGR